MTYEPRAIWKELKSRSLVMRPAVVSIAALDEGEGGGGGGGQVAEGKWEEAALT